VRRGRECKVKKSVREFLVELDKTQRRGGADALFGETVAPLKGRPLPMWKKDGRLQATIFGRGVPNPTSRGGEKTR